jgi:hypothetical protein
MPMLPCRGAEVGGGGVHERLAIDAAVDRQ